VAVVPLGPAVDLLITNQRTPSELLDFRMILRVNVADGCRSLHYAASHAHPKGEGLRKAMLSSGPEGQTAYASPVGLLRRLQAGISRGLNRH